MRNECTKVSRNSDGKPRRASLPKLNRAAAASGSFATSEIDFILDFVAERAVGEGERTSVSRAILGVCCIQTVDRAAKK